MTRSGRGEGTESPTSSGGGPRQIRIPRAVWLSMLGLFAIPCLLAVARHRFFLSGALDMGFYVQDVWLAAHGEWHNTLIDIHIFQDHFSPVLFILAPLAYLPTAESLLVVQSAALALGVLPAFRLGVYHRDVRLGYIAVVWYALSVGIWYGAMFDFHPVALAVPILLWLMILIDEPGPLWKTVLALVLLVLIREDAAVLGALVVWRGAWRERSAAKWIVGALAMAVGVLYVALGPGWFGDSGYFFWIRYADYGLGLGEIVSRLPQNLITAVSRVFHIDQLITLTALLAPFLVVAPLLGWRRSWPGLLLLLSNLVSSYGPVTTLYFQYALLVVPFLIWGAVAVWARMETARPRAGRAAIVFTVAVFLLLGPLWHRGYAPPDRFANQILAHSDRVAMGDVLKGIPPAASVSASNLLLPHLADRKAIYPFPGPMYCPNAPGFYIERTRAVDYVVIDDPTEEAWRDQLIAWGFTLRLEQAGVNVWVHNVSFESRQCRSRADIFAEEVERMRSEVSQEDSRP